MEARALEQMPWIGGSGPDRFGRALLLAAVIEVVLVVALARAPRPAVVVQPTVVQLRMIQPAPIPKAPPAPPKPPPPKPPPPVPVTPAPVTPPVPTPPPPKRAPAIQRHARPVVHRPPPPVPVPVTPAPMPPAPVMQAPPPSPVVAATALSRYTGMVRNIVLSHLVVPAQIEETGLSGTCVLEFVLAPDGTLESVRVATSSGLHAVDQAALDAIHASGFPAFLPDMPGHALTFTLPVHVSAGDQ